MNTDCYILWMTDDAPHAMAAEIIALLAVQLQLRIGQSLHREARGEEPDTEGAKHAGRLCVERHARPAHPEGKREGQRDESQEGRFGEIRFEERRVPESGVLGLELLVARVVSAAGERARHDAVEESTAPGCDAG